jgi:hypothetical protein
MVDSLVQPGTTAIPNFIDPIYPVEGRFLADSLKPPA